jgi:hypothetical protein
VRLTAAEKIFRITIDTESTHRRRTKLTLRPFYGQFPVLLMTQPSALPEYVIQKHYHLIVMARYLFFAPEAISSTSPALCPQFNILATTIVKLFAPVSNP